MKNSKLCHYIEEFPEPVFQIVRHITFFLRSPYLVLHVAMTSSRCTKHVNLNDFRPILPSQYFSFIEYIENIIKMYPVDSNMYVVQYILSFNSLNPCEAYTVMKKNVGTDQIFL